MEAKKKLLRESREWVKRIFNLHSDWNAGKIYRELVAVMGGDKDRTITLNAVQKQLVDLKEEYNKTRVLDEQWHLGTLESYPIPLDVVPVILKVQEKGTHFKKFTIRQALWVARLSRVISDIRQLDDISWYYALHEKKSKISGEPFDTTRYDCLLKSPKHLIKVFEGEYPETRTDFEIKKEAFEAITGAELCEPSYEIYFKGNEAWARRGYQPDVLLGTRDRALELLKETPYWHKSTKIPDGDFTIKLPIPLIWDKALEIENKGGK